MICSDTKNIDETNILKLFQMDEQTYNIASNGRSYLENLYVSKDIIFCI